MSRALSFAFALVVVVSWSRPLAAADDLAAKIDEIVNRPEYKQARWGILVVDAKSGSTVYARDAERLFTPASTTKLFTCATALATFGPDYRFVTPVYRRGEIKGGVLHGDLIMVASGDLTFGGRVGKDGKTVFANADHTYANSGLMESTVTDTNPLYALDQLAKQIAKAGVKEVAGEVLVDDRLFGRARGTGSGPDLLTPIMVNDNVLDIVVSPGKTPGEPAKVRMRPETAFFQMDADVTTVEADKPLRIVLHETGSTSFSVRGEIPVNKPPVVRIYFVGEPVLFARALFIEALRRQGIRTEASLHRLGSFDVPPSDGYSNEARLASFESAPFSEAIAVTLKVSHNLYASTLPMLVAAKNGERSLAQGLRRQGAFLKKLDLPVETISFAGGAGGASADAATPSAMVKLLQAMSKRPEADAYFNALPRLGVDGTLAGVVADDSPAKGKVRAKTGTLVLYDPMNERLFLRSKALAGELETVKGTKLYFAMFVNDVPLAPGITATREGKVLTKLCEIVCEHGP